MLDKKAALDKIEELVERHFDKGMHEEVPDLEEELKEHFNACIEEAVAGGATLGCCNHKEFANGRCGEMVCHNYYGKHMVQRQEDDENDDMAAMIEEQRG